MKPWIKTVSSMLFITPAILGLGIASVYAEEEETRIEIMVDKENDSDAQVEVLVNGNAEKFVLPELADGESRTLVTESGNTIVATNVDGKTAIELDGKEIVIMAPHHSMGADFKFIGDHGSASVDENKVFVVGGNLSDEVKAALQNTLNSYTSEKELVFPESGANSHVMVFDGASEIITELDSEEGGAHKEIKIIKKRIEKRDQ